MKDDKLVFRTRCMTIAIDYSKCEPSRDGTAEPQCGFACIKADRMYDRSLLRIEANRPVLAVPPEAAQKVSNESLCWEYACRIAGPGAIGIEVDFPGIKDYRRKALDRR